MEGSEEIQEKRKILFFITSLGKGGAEKVLVDLLNSLPADKFEITLKTLYGGVNQKKLSSVIKYSNVIKTRNAFLKKILIRLYYRVLPSKFFYRFFLKGDYEVECAYLEGKPTEIIAKSVNKRSKKIAFIHTDIETNFGVKNVYGNIKRAKKLYNKFDDIICVSNEAKISIEKIIGKLKNAQVLHNIIDFQKVRELSVEFSADKNNGRFNIISLGRLCDVKGYFRLLEALKDVKEEKYKLLIIGDGEQKDKLEEFANRYSINVEFLGFKENPFPYVVASDLYVCSSYAEGYSTSVAEALSLGVPVLTTNCAGMKELVRKNGLIVENNTQAIKEGLHLLMGDFRLYNQLKQEAEALKHLYKKENEIIRYIDLFMEK